MDRVVKLRSARCSFG